MKKKNIKQFAAKQTKAVIPDAPKVHAPTMAPRIIEKQQYYIRRDVSEWKWAQSFYTQVREPRSYLIQDVFTDVASDALFTSQLNNRKEQTISAPFEMFTSDNKVDDEITAKLRAITILPDVFNYMLDSEWFGNSLIEFSAKNGLYNVELINRRNVVGSKGRFYPDIYLGNYIEYRDVAEYGAWIVEFNSGNIGAINKIVPHVLFKKFAQSCWSELCEIYGIPPRVMKTETRDPAMLNRAEAMMKDVGAASWFIIDNSEEFSFANNVNTNGDVYKNLITLCNNEICLPVTGAIIGQDTKNGNESKEKVSQEMLARLVESDKRMCEVYMNTIVIPAFIRIGWLPSTISRFRFSAVENVDKLWEYTNALLQWKEVDNTFIEEKFGIKVTDKAISKGANPAFQ